MNNKKIQFILIFAICITIVATVATYVYFSQKEKEITLADSQVLSAQNENYTPNPNYLDKNSFTVLLLGYGGAGHSGGFLTDVIQVVHFDFDTQKIAFISIPRDLFVTLPSGTNAKINTAFTLGNAQDPIHTGAEVAKQMATVVTGLPIDAFVSIDFNGFKRAIGGPLDGITVTTSETLDDKWYPISGQELNTCGKSPEEVATLSNTYSGFELERQFECRYERIYFPVGTHTMEGGDALAFVRSRHGSAGGDFSRSKRQQEVLLGVRDKLFTLEALEKIPFFFKEFIAHVSTDLDIDTIQTLAPKLSSALDMKTLNITLSTENVFMNSKSAAGAYIVIPKEGSGSFNQTHSFIETELEK